MKYVFSLLIIVVLFSCSEPVDNPDNVDFTTIFEKSGGTQTPTYDEVIQFYQELDKAYIAIKTYEIGTTDIGKPLTLVTFNPNRSFESEFSKNQDVRRILINNGIHPGESDGIDATMMLMRDLAQGTIETPENTWVGAIAVYNIGGALNRNSTSRTNQNGPEAYGFRGNAKNYDLNRDFIKNDTKNAEAFTEIFHLIKPDVFIDNHVSNGADYQYTLTHLFTQHNKLGGVLGEYTHQDFQPKLEQDLKSKDWDITPYVNVFNRTPEKGFSQFMDHPRYSTGYTTLWNTIGLMVETHMLKPYKPRVEGTYELMKSALKITAQEGEKIKALRKDAFNAFAKADTYPLAYTIDSTKTSTLKFLGYEGEMIPSEITGKQRLKYNREKPFTKDVTYYNYFKPTKEVTIPKAYFMPRGYRDIALKLRENDIRFKQLKRDTTFMAEVYHIDTYQTSRNPYEGHYPHYGTKVRKTQEEVTIPRDGYMILVEDNKEGLRYLLETLEPEANDSFFNWNFFDTILQQKEGFSPYVWEDKALAFLNEHPDIKVAFEAKKLAEPSFAQNWYAQLAWIHKKSPNYEKAHLRYPIVRMLR
ncbi:M14 family metallopeptidase [uncultured Dokdonia sp.]|uniref:M14 family metallopeptidase n=1 Tax=uncultured Dokdonia sp. TaxID=575653 RepID=UPI00262285D5|nr:M14 family metallopeptidase [uncultured Dokdonia sp.]